jgi:hypothetical protein
MIIKICLPFTLSLSLSAVMNGKKGSIFDIHAEYSQLDVEVFNGIFRPFTLISCHMLLYAQCRPLSSEAAASIASYSSDPVRTIPLVIVRSDTTCDNATRSIQVIVEYWLSAVCNTDHIRCIGLSLPLSLFPFHLTNCIFPLSTFISLT